MEIVPCAAKRILGYMRDDHCKRSTKKGPCASITGFEVCASKNACGAQGIHELIITCPLASVMKSIGA